MINYFTKSLTLVVTFMCLSQNSFAAAASAATEESAAFKRWSSIFAKRPDVVLSSNRCGISFPLASYDKLLDHVDPKAKVLDVGGGVGFFARVAGEKGADVTVMDIDKTALARLATEQPEVTIRHQSVLEMKDDGVYDVVFSAYMLQLLSAESVSLAIEKMVKALKPGGRLMIALPPFERMKSYGLRRFVEEGETSPVSVPSAEVYKPIKKTIAENTRETVYKFLEDKGIVLSEEQKAALIRKQEAEFTLTAEDKAALIAKHGDKARYGFNVVAYIPELFTYLDRTILRTLFESFGLESISFFDIKDETGEAPSLGAMATKPA